MISRAVQVTLDAIAADPGKAHMLPRNVLLDLTAKALTAHAALTTALLSASTEASAPEHDRLIGTIELAKLMGVSPNFIYDHRHEWPFTIQQPGTRTMFSLRGFEAWVAERDGRAVPSARAHARKGA